MVVLWVGECWWGACLWALFKLEFVVVWLVFVWLDFVRYGVGMVIFDVGFAGGGVFCLIGWFRGVGCLELLRVWLGWLVLVFWVVDLLGCFRIWL